MNNVKLDYDSPTLNIKAVAKIVGLLPVTLRAWERRYGLPSPKRGQQGYRLYSEHDVNTLLWLKEQLDSGRNIGQAANKLIQLIEAGNDPAPHKPAAADIHTPQISLALPDLKQGISSSLANYDTASASDQFRRAISIYPADDVFSGIVEPLMIEVGEKWHAGSISIAEEHYVTEFFHEHLQSMLSTTVKPFREGIILAACMPGELHEIGLLMIVAHLRLRGWNVVYMGPNLGLERLDEVIRKLKPRMILFSATLPQNSGRISELMPLMLSIPQPHPVIVLGGPGFQHMKENHDLPHTILSGSREETLQAVESILVNEKRMDFSLRSK